MNIYDIKRKVYLSFFSRSFILHYYRFLSRKQYILSTIKKFGREKDTAQLLPLMRRAYTKFRWNAEEFFLFKYEQLNDKERSEFCPEFDHNIFCLKVNNFKTAKDFRDKMKTYIRFKPFFKRECILLTCDKDLHTQEFNEFIKHNETFLAKQLDACCGRGILKITRENIDTLHSLFKDGQRNRFILEPYIIQCKELSALHPESVNTLRIPTINYGDHIEIFHPFLRIGKGSNFVDNAGSGGIGCNIDIQSGSIVCAGDENGIDYTHHPDTNIKLIGFNIPKWGEAMQTAKELAKMVPDVKYVGWDLALTENGWVMIEGNEDGQFLFQYFSHKGVAKEIKEIYEKLK